MGRFSLGTINTYVTFEYYYKTQNQHVDEGLKSSLGGAALAAMLPFMGQAANKKPINVSTNLIKAPITATSNNKQQIKKQKVEPLPKEQALSPTNVVLATLTGEARGEGVEGMKAVLNVLNNRLKAAKVNDLNKLKDVALQNMQFSIWNKLSDVEKAQFVNQMRKTPQWNIANKLLIQLKAGELEDNTNGATFYFNPNIVRPNWSKKFIQTTTIGNHDFYNHGKVNVSPFLPKSRKLNEEIDTPNNGFVTRPIGGPNLVNFSPNFKSAPGIYLKSDQIHTPTIQAMRMRSIRTLKKRKKK